MSMGDQEQFLTIKTLAAWVTLDHSEESVNRTLRQLRHWTQNDLLRTEGVKNTGKGIPRLYAEDPTFQVAAVLVELSRFGVTLDVLKPVTEAMYRDWDDEGGFYLHTALTDMDSFLQVSWETDPKTLEIKDAKVAIFDVMDDLEDIIDRKPSSSIIINMTNVAQRTYNNKNAWKKAKEGNYDEQDGT